MKTLNIGVVGYSGQKFDEQRALDLLNKAYDLVLQASDASKYNLVSGLTDVGIPSLAYQLASERGWSTVGIACEKARKYDCYPVDVEHIIGKNWGDESAFFLDSIDVLVRIGGGTQSMKETNEMKLMEKPVYEFELESYEV